MNYRLRHILLDKSEDWKIIRFGMNSVSLFTENQEKEAYFWLPFSPFLGETFDFEDFRWFFLENPDELE